MMDTSSDYIGEKKSRKNKKESEPRPEEKKETFIRYIPQKVNVIRNIMSITELKSSKYNKHVYIFGENHNANFNCSNSISASEFIIEQIKFLDKTKAKTEAKTIDVFIEISRIISNSPTEKHNLTSLNILNIFKEFKSCFKPDKKDCKYENTRFHYSDIRSIWGEGDIKNTDEVIGRMIDIFCLDLFAPEELIEVWGQTKDFLNEYYPEEFKDYINCKSEIDLIIRGMRMFNGSKLFKNMSAISYKEVRFVLQEWIKSMVPQYFRTLRFKNIDEFVANSKTYPSQFYETAYNRICTALFSYISVYMDVYLLSRMFRTFNLKLGESKEREEPKNIIILVGNMHADNYVTILKKLGFEVVFRNSNENGDCLDISKLQQPLFFNKSEIENYSKAKSKDDYGDSMEEGMF